MEERELTQEQIDGLLKAFFKHGYSSVDGEYVGVVEYHNDCGAPYNNVIGLIPNDHITGSPLLISIYKLCDDCEPMDAFNKYTRTVRKVVPDLTCTDDRGSIRDGLNDLWEFGWKPEAVTPTEDVLFHIRDYVNHYSDGHHCLPIQQAPYEAGRASGIQQACKDILRFIDDIQCGEKKV